MKSSSPDLLILLETKIVEKQMKRKLKSLGFFNYSYMASQGLSGVFCVARKKGVDFQVVSKNKKLINCTISSDPPNNPWTLSAVYNLIGVVARNHFCRNFPKIKEIFPSSWLVMGDLNGILIDTKSTSRRKLKRTSHDFRLVINMSVLLNLGAQVTTSLSRIQDLEELILKPD